jgi:hypothetical protein
MRRLLPVIVCLACLPAASCTPRAVPENLPPLERQWPPQERIFRHKVHIDFPGKTTPYSFDGIARFSRNADGPVVHITCLGDLGLTLCAMTVTPEGHSTAYLHPGFAKIPRVEEHIALCVASVWFAALPSAGGDGHDPPQQEAVNGALPEHSRASGGVRLVRASGSGVRWTVSYVPATPQPARIVFTNERDGYTVRIRLVEELSAGGRRP